MKIKQNFLPPFLRGRLLAQLTLVYMALLLLAYFCGLLQPVSFPVPPGEEISLVGRVKTESVASGENRYRLLLKVSEIQGAPWQGLVYLYYEGGPLLPGSYVAARGQVMSFTPYGNPGAFDYNAYLQRQGVAAGISCYYGGELIPLAGFASEKSSVRSRLLAAFEAVAGENAALLKGVFLGDKGDLSFAQKNVLSFSGVLHAFAVSGLHVSYVVLAALLLAGSGRRRRWARLALTACLLLFYLHLTGMPPSILRASIMAICLLLATALDEKSDPYTALAIGALLCLIYRPLWIIDAGFQLSFAAAWGLFYLTPSMKLLLSGTQPYPKPIDSLFRAFSVTLAASFATMPLICWYFYHISIISWLISPLFVLGAGISVLLCFAAALLAIFSVLPAQLPLYFSELLMSRLYALSEWGSSLPGAYISSGKTPLAAVLLFYLALALLPVLAPKFRRPRLFLLLSCGLLVGLLSFAPALARQADGRLEVAYIDIGQGDATLILTPAGHSILLDGGGNYLAPGSVGENALLPYLRYRGLRRIDLLISSHPDADHIDGLLTVLENLPVGQVLYADAFPDNQLQERLLDLAAAQGASLTPAVAGQRFGIEPGLTMEILHPPAGIDYGERDINNGSLTLLLSHDELDFLFTGDVYFTELATLPTAEIVKLPHHGSKSNYDEAAYQALAAEAVIISAGRNNSYGHPAPSVIEYWQSRAAIYRTDRHGAITIFSDGRRWQAKTYWEAEP